MNKSRLLAPLALASLLVTALPMTGHNVSHAAILQAPVKGGTIIDGLFEEPARLLPNSVNSTFAQMVQQTIFSPLFYTDDSGVIHTGLASEIPTTANGDISKDGLSYTFKLRPGLKWSDGAPLDAHDVDYTWKVWTDKDFIAATTVGFNQIKSADVSADGLSITFHLKAFFAPFVYIWADYWAPMPAHVLSKLTPKQLNTAPFTNIPTVSSGPFMVTARKAAESITEVRNPNFYMPGRPYADKLIFRIIPDQVAMTNALRAGEVDCGWFLDVAQTNTLQHISGYTFVGNANHTANFEIGLLNLKNPILADVRVRQALEYAIDRPTMVKDVRHGAAALAASDQPPSLWTYDPSVKPYPFDPVKAGALLDAAGWKLNGDGRRVKNGKILTLRYSTTARNTWRAQDELIVLQDLQNVGIDIRIINYPGSTYFGTVLPGGDFDIGEFESNASVDPDISIAGAFDSSQVSPHGGNWGFYQNPAYDALIHQEESTADVAQRKAIFAKMSAIMNHDMPALWYFHPADLAEHRNTLHNYAPAPFSAETWNTWDWWKG